MYAYRCFNKHQEKFPLKEMEKFMENIRFSRSVVPAANTKKKKKIFVLVVFISYRRWCCKGICNEQILTRVKIYLHKKGSWVKIVLLKIIEGLILSIITLMHFV